MFAPSRNLVVQFLAGIPHCADRAALELPGETVSHAQLGLRVVSVARALEAQGVGPGACIAVGVRDTALAWTLVLAAGWLGARVVCEGAGEAVGGLTHMLRDEPEVRPNPLPAIPLRVSADWMRSLPVVPLDTVPEAGVASGDTPWVIGRPIDASEPAGMVCLSHQELAARDLLTPFPRKLGMRPVVVSLFPPLSLVTLNFLMATLLRGGTMVVGQSPDDWETLRVAVVAGTPEQHALLLLESIPIRARRLPVAWVGGAPMPDGLRTPLLLHFAAVWHVYVGVDAGPTAGSWLTVPPAWARRRPAPPMANVA